MLKLSSDIFFSEDFIWVGRPKAIFGHLSVSEKWTHISWINSMENSSQLTFWNSIFIRFQSTCFTKKKFFSSLYPVRSRLWYPVSRKCGIFFVSPHPTTRKILLSPRITYSCFHKPSFAMTWTAISFFRVSFYSTRMKFMQFSL